MIGNERGNLGENIAHDHLMKKGYKIIERNYHCLYGEVDMIASKDDYIVFVEVKLRKSNARVSGKESVSYSKQKKIISTAAVFLEENECFLQPRFDVISITAYGADEFAVEHIESAFDTQDIFY